MDYDTFLLVIYFFFDIMSRLLSRRKSSIKSNVKPMVKEPKIERSVEFRWSTTAAQHGTTDITSLLNFNLIDLDNCQQKLFLSSPIATSKFLRVHFY